MQVAPVLLALALALAILSSSADQQCNLTGTWDNDLGTTVTIGAVNSEGEFDGSYTTSEADKPNEIKTFPLRGFQQIHKEPTFGFTVRWTFSDSTSVFVGQCFVGEHGKEILKTTWLMRLWVNSIHDNWKATSMDVDTFIRKVPPYVE